VLLCTVVFVLLDWMYRCLNTCLQLLYPLDGLLSLSLPLVANFSLKSALPDLSIVTSCFHTPFFWKIFFRTFTLSLCLSLPVRCTSDRQQMTGSCFFLIQPGTLWLLIGEPLTFRVII
jgi:hypothetical protein